MSIIPDRRQKGPESGKPLNGPSNNTYESRRNAPLDYQGQVDSDRLRSMHPRRNRKNMRTAIAAGTAAAVGLVGAVVGFATLGGEKGPSDRTPGNSAGDFPDRNGGDAEAPAQGSPLERFASTLDGLESDPSLTDLRTAVSNALGSEIVFDDAHTTPPRFLDPNTTMFLLSSDLDRRLVANVIPTEGVDTELYTSTFETANIAPFQSESLPGFDIYYDYGRDGAQQVPTDDATSGRLLAVGDDYMIFVQLHNINPSDQYGLAPAPQGGGDLSLGVATEIYKVIK